MADYFTRKHFKLLNKWKSTVYDNTSPEQQQAYDELVAAYGVTKQWAEALKQRLFKDGWTKTVRKPIDQWQKKFTHYNWARIYPSRNSPDALAYTVGIDAELGFIVKIDLVDTKVDDPSLRPKYLQIRGEITSSPIAAVKPAEEGLALDFAELVDWSVAAIRRFKLSYDDVASRLALSHALSDDELLNHFDGKAAFRTVRQLWSPEATAIFCSLARAVHAAGLDWWHTDIKAMQIRFGRKDKGQSRAAGVLGYVFCTRQPSIWINDLIDGLPSGQRKRITEALVDMFEEALTESRESVSEWQPTDTKRPGLWPDQLDAEAVDPGEDSADETSIFMESGTMQPFNRIYYGPPGTGKTFELQKLLRDDYTQAAEAISPEEWKARKIVDEISTLTWWEAIAAALHDLKGKAKVAQLIQHPFLQAVIAAKERSKHVTQTVWGTLQQHTVEESKTVKAKTRVAPFIFDKSEDSVWSFAGDWEEVSSSLTALVDAINKGPVGTAKPIERYVFVTFHQSYGYEEFVEGLRPVLDSETASDQIGYEIRHGAFRALCQRARLAPDQRFAVVIDEINRGNVSKIFGELITLIEVDKRDPLDGTPPPAEVRLAYSGDKFSVPSNVDIIGSMNTADRSLALVDTALRRRFDFEAKYPDVRDVPGAPLHQLRVTIGENEIDIPKMLAAINQRIEALYDRDHTIGHAYFIPLKYISDGQERFDELARIFRKKLIPLLEEYFFEESQKIRLVLADNKKKHEEARFVEMSDDHEGELARLFGDEHGLDAYGTKKRYTLRDEAFSLPEAYIGIYQESSR